MGADERQNPKNPQNEGEGADLQLVAVQTSSFEKDARL